MTHLVSVNEYHCIICQYSTWLLLDEFCWSISQCYPNKANCLLLKAPPLSLTQPYAVCDVTKPPLLLASNNCLYCGALCNRGVIALSSHFKAAVFGGERRAGWRYCHIISKRLFSWAGYMYIGDDTDRSMGRYGLGQKCFLYPILLKFRYSVIYTS